MTKRKDENKRRDKRNTKKIGSFGSYERGEESEESDTDILVEFYEPVGSEFFDFKEFLERILDEKVHLVTVKAVKPETTDNILKEVIFA